jgi:hypothetical protein
MISRINPLVEKTIWSPLIDIEDVIKQDSKTFKNHIFGLKTQIAKPTCYQNGHNNHFYFVLQHCVFPKILYTV